MNLNQVNLIGRVTRDPELRALPSGTKVVSIGVATNSTWKDKEGEKKEEVEFHNVVAFSKLAEIIGQYVRKGQLIYIEGRLKTTSWEKDGAKRYKTEIVAQNMQMGPKAANSSSQTDSGRTDLPSEEVAGTSEGEINPDDVPF